MGDRPTEDAQSSYERVNRNLIHAVNNTLIPTVRAIEDAFKWLKDNHQTFEGLKYQQKQQAIWEKAITQLEAIRKSSSDVPGFDAEFQRLVHERLKEYFDAAQETAYQNKIERIKSRCKEHAMRIQQDLSHERTRFNIAKRQYDENVQQHKRAAEKVQERWDQDVRERDLKVKSAAQEAQLAQQTAIDELNRQHAKELKEAQDAMPAGYNPLINQELSTMTKQAERYKSQRETSKAEHAQTKLELQTARRDLAAAHRSNGELTERLNAHGQNPSELAISVIDKLGEDKQKMTDQCNALQKRFDDLSATLQQSERDSSEKTQLLTTTQNELKDCQAKLRNYNVNMPKLEIELRTKQATIDRKNDEYARLNSTLTSTEQESDGYRVQLTATKHDLALRINKIRRLEQQIAEQKGEIEEKEETLDRVLRTNDTNAGLAKRIEDLEAENGELLSDVDRAEREKDETDDAAAEFVRTADQARLNAVTDLNNGRTQWTTEKNDLEEEVRRLRAERNQFARDAELKSKQIDKLEQDARVKDASYNKLNAHFNEADRNKAAALEQQQATYDQKLEAAKTEADMKLVRKQTAFEAELDKRSRQIADLDASIKTRDESDEKAWADAEERDRQLTARHDDAIGAKDRRIIELEGEKAKLEQGLNNANDQANQLSAQIDSLQLTSQANGLKMSEDKDKIQQLEARIETDKTAHEKAINEQRARILDIEEEIKNQNNQIADKDRRITELESTNADLQSSLDEGNRKVREHEETIKKHEQKNETNTQTIAQQENSLAQLRDELGSIVNHLNRAIGSEGQDTALERLQVMSQSWEQRGRDIGDAINSIKNELDKRKTDSRPYEPDAESLLTYVETLKLVVGDQVSDKNSANAEAELRIKELDAKVAGQTSEITEFKRKNEQLERDISRLEGSVEAGGRQADQQTSEIGRLMREKRDMVNQCNAAIQQCKTAQEQARNAATRLQWKTNDCELLSSTYQAALKNIQILDTALQLEKAKHADTTVSKLQRALGRNDQILQKISDTQEAYRKAIGEAEREDNTQGDVEMTGTGQETQPQHAQPQRAQPPHVQLQHAPLRHARPQQGPPPHAQSQHALLYAQSQRAEQQRLEQQRAHQPRAQQQRLEQQRAHQPRAQQQHAQQQHAQQQHSQQQHAQQQHAQQQHAQQQHAQQQHAQQQHAQQQHAQQQHAQQQHAQSQHAQQQHAQPQQAGSLRVGRAQRGPQPTPRQSTVKPPFTPESMEK